MKILYFFLFLLVIFALLDPDPDPDQQLKLMRIHADPIRNPESKAMYSIVNRVNTDLFSRSVH